MNATEKKQLVELSAMLNQVATKWHSLPSGIQTAMFNDLVECNVMGFRGLADRLNDAANSSVGTCARCGAPFSAKATGRARKFCSDLCKVHAHKEAKKAEWEVKIEAMAIAKKEADSWLATLTAEGDSAIADNGGAGELTSEGSEGDSKADNGGAVVDTLKPKSVSTIGIKEAVKILNREGNKVRYDKKTGLYNANGTKRTEADIIKWAMELKRS